jgi:hypothetical protein
MAQAGPGKIRLFNDFCGPEIPVANAVAYGTSAGGCNYYLGDFAVKGDLADTDAGVVALGIASGAVRVTGTNEDNVGTALTTDLVFSVPLNGPLVLEARVQMQALTARNAFVGFCGTMADNVAPPLVDSNATTHTLTATDIVGFNFNSIYTGASLFWHTVYNGGTTTGPTATSSTVTDVVPVAGEWQILRIQIDINGTVRWWIDGALKATVANAATVTATDMLGVIVGCFGTTTTITDIDVDYILVNANRDWTV